MAKTYYFLMRWWWWCVFCTRPTLWKESLNSDGQQFHQEIKIFRVLSHWKKSTGGHITPLWWWTYHSTLIHYPDSEPTSLVLIRYCCPISREATNTIFKIFNWPDGGLQKRYYKLVCAQYTVHNYLYISTLVVEEKYVNTAENLGQPICTMLPKVEVQTNGSISSFLSFKKLFHFIINILLY